MTDIFINNKNNASGMAIYNKVLSGKKNMNYNIYWQKIIYTILLLAFGLLGSTVARADCLFNEIGRIDKTITLPATISVKRNVQPGTSIWDSDWYNAGSTSVRCNEGGNKNRIGYEYPMTSVAGYSGVYATSNPSIGVRIRYSNSTNTSSAALGYYPQVDIPFSPNFLIGTTYTPTFMYRVELVVIDTIQPTAVTIPQSGQFVYYYSSLLTSQLFISGTTNIAVQSLTCNTTTPNVPVSLGDVYAGTLNQTGPTTTENTFNVDFNCTGNESAKISAKLEGAQSTGVSDDSVLALTNEGAPGVASGLGVQILYNSQPLRLNQPIELVNSALTTERVTFKTRYYQTQTKVMPGQANSVAILNVTYQ
ncbi:fimbrial protein [Budviciaceae bacterium CWB-B4]|uniref:Fimbrial protein n=1 Tax=Limnobaculum xujianqingii TaxID=2738837 RepID=A0A9D7AJN7_9GAMM|nr:fimbrial protein [Limnobaculum xujianqingii]MBK5073868.1 fimbrial protein [Limnobaculum xujianqingii]MBK5177238.1 fimbrial protein [Limnobaculum xujianqingii]